MLAGDFNVRAARSRTLRDLTEPEWGFSEAGPGHRPHPRARRDGVAPLPVARRAAASAAAVLLSDHAPVELEVT